MCNENLLEFAHRNDPESRLPCGIFEAQPVSQKRPVTCHFQLESANELSILITGNTWAFKSRFDAFGMPMSKIEPEGDENPRYIRRVLSCISTCVSLFRVLG